MRVAVLDLGKSNAKVALVDTADAVELEVLAMPTPVRAAPLYPQPDVEALWTFFLDGLATLRERGPIDAIGVTTHGATVALLDADGALALPVLDYEHDGPERYAAEYDRVRPPFAATGSPRLPGGLNVGAQLFWQERCFPERFARVAHLLTWPQYWAYRLCGERASELTSLGCHTDLVEPASGAPSALSRARGWDRLIPPVRRPGERLGTVTPEVARLTGLASDTPVHVGIHDSNASLVPHLLAGGGPRSVVSSGTWAIVMALGGRAPALDAARDTLVNIDARGEPVPSARFMGGREFTVASRRGGETGDAEALDRALDRVLEKRAMLLPSVVRGSGPFPGEAAEWTVDEAALDDAEHAIVVGHYLAMMSVTCLDLVGARGPVAVEGPFAANRPCLAMLAAATGRPVETGASVTGTSVGTAMLIEAPRAPPARVPFRLEAERRSALARQAALWRERADAR